MTLNGGDESDAAWKAAAQANWGGAPCGSNTSGAAPGSPEFFAEVAEFRYRSQAWHRAALERLDVAGKDVLELGPGMGTDHRVLARRGARLVGIDLTPRHLELTRRNLACEGLTSRLVRGDAERLPFAASSFDLVYSFGVVHHSPDTARIVREVRRVLRPGGRAWLAVYHRDSLFFWWSLFLWDWVRNRGFLRESLQARLSRVEYPNDNPDLLVQLFTRRGFARLFEQAGFRAVRAHVDHLTREDVTPGGRHLPEWVLARLGRLLGWYVVVEATA